VHERGPEVPPPPLPPDVHALQSYFFDEESKEWIRTVLAPMGRELAARWQGAHKIPEDRAHPAKAKAAKKGSSTVGIVVIVVVLAVLLGGAGVVASQSGLLPAGTTPKPTVAGSEPSGAVPTAAVPTAVASGPAAVPTEAPPVATAPVVVPTRAPTLPPQVNLPPGPRATLPDGTIVVYTGPTSATRGGFLPATFTFVAANGRAASGDVTIVLGDITKNPPVAGLLDANGRIALDVSTALPIGQYPLSVIYRASRAQLATITIR
jgi:hypothetical protein